MAKQSLVTKDTRVTKNDAMTMRLLRCARNDRINADGKDKIMTKKLILILTALLMLCMVACKTPDNQPAKGNDTPAQPEKPTNPTDSLPRLTVIMKGVGIDIPQEDFFKMKDAGIDILTTEWGMEESTTKAIAFLDKAQAAGLKAVMDGGFSYRAWGFTDADWQALPKGKRPVWQKERVQSWIRALKDHPAVYAWDICNEYGENLPSGVSARNSEWPKTATTLEQLNQARNDVLQVDPHRPIVIRTYEWDLDEPPLGSWRPFKAGIADIVMLNLYSNYLEKGKLQWPTVVQDVGADCVKAIKAKDPKCRVWVSVSAFEDMPAFQRPTPQSLSRDIEQTLKIPNIDAVAFFEWGPSLGDAGNWYLPQTGPDLWEVIKSNIKQLQ